MSGDSGGIILGLVAAPIILAGAAAAGIAYGAFQAGSFLVKSAVNYAKKKQAEKALFINNCSKDLEKLYSDMELVVQQQAQAFHGISLETQKKLDAAAGSLKSMADAAATPDLTTLNSQIDQSHSIITETMTAHSSKVRAEILDKGKKALNSCADTMNAAMKTKADIVDWKKKTADALAAQKAMAYDSLRDAIASVKLMERLATNSRSDAFRGQYAAMKSSLTKAQASFDNGMYESAFAASSTIVRQVAMNVAAQQADQMELDFAAMQLQARMEGLLMEMKNRRYVEYTADVTPGEVYEEDLDEFSQGAYSKMQTLLAQKLDQFRNPKTLYEIQSMTQEFERELEPRALKVMQVAQQVMLGYHEKLKVLDVIREFMESQNYTMDWAAPVGDDMSQKLVVSFHNRTGSTISVTLDNQAAIGNIEQMALEVLTFYNDGRPVSEQEKLALRTKMNTALSDAGIMGNVSCTGQVNQPSAQTSMRTEEGVLNEQVQRIL